MSTAVDYFVTSPGSCEDFVARLRHWLGWDARPSSSGTRKGISRIMGAGS